MPDHTMGMSPEPPIENLQKEPDRKLPYKEDQLHPCGEHAPIGRGQDVYPDRADVEDLPRTEPPVEAKTAHEEAVLEAIQEGQTGSLACQADPECDEPFAPPSDIPFGDSLAEEQCDPPRGSNE